MKIEKINKYRVSLYALVILSSIHTVTGLYFYKPVVGFAILWSLFQIVRILIIVKVIQYRGDQEEKDPVENFLWVLFLPRTYILLSLIRDLVTYWGLALLIWVMLWLIKAYLINRIVGFKKRITYKKT